MSKYAWSLDGDKWHSGLFESFDDAVADAIGEAENKDGTPATHVHIGECSEYHNSQFFPDAHDIVNHMANAADDVGGEYSYDYPNVEDEGIDQLTEQLHKLLDEWCNDNNITVSFYNVKSSIIVNLR